MTETPSPWSPHNEQLQVAWDSTSLSDLLFCPRYYQYTHLDGWSGATNDLEFGQFAASGFELYQKLRLAGESREEAAVKVARFLMEATWPVGQDKPWGGEVERLWRCEGTTKYRNAKGNPAKCPYSHKGKWFPGPAPDICGSCGSPIEVSDQFQALDEKKNRMTLLRLVLWYIFEQPEDLDEGLRPYQFPDGTAAVELSFRVALPWQSPYGDQYLLTGHGDYIGSFGGEHFWVDNKTTTKSLNEKFFDGYSPHVQVDTYDVVGQIMFPDLNIQGVIIDAAQSLVGGAAFGRQIYYKTDSLREEHLETIYEWIRRAEDYAARGYWPMNKRSCWLCPFKQICSLPPEAREAGLQKTFTKRERWNPLATR